MQVLSGPTDIKKKEDSSSSIISPHLCLRLRWDFREGLWIAVWLIWLWITELHFSLSVVLRCLRAASERLRYIYYWFKPISSSHWFNRYWTVEKRATFLPESKGMVWFSLVWFGLVWFGFVWFGLVFWYGLTGPCLSVTMDMSAPVCMYASRCILAPGCMYAPSLVWFGLVSFGLVWFYSVWFWLVWFSLVWFGLVRLG